MCPLRIGSVVMMASSVMSTGGLTALVVKKFGVKTDTKISGSMNEAGGVNDGCENRGENNGTSESRITCGMA